MKIDDTRSFDVIFISREYDGIVVKLRKQSVLNIFFVFAVIFFLPRDF